MTGPTETDIPADALARRYDLLLLDLDGTVYLGGRVIPHAGEVVHAAAAVGARSMFVTNNASRSPAEVAASLTGMGIPATAVDVITSPQAAAEMLAARHPAGAKVLVVGTDALVDAVGAVGLAPVRLAADDPAAVVQGHSPDTGWRQLAEACIALRGGADWVACNVDPTLPTDRGLLPGNGAMVQALRAATGREPRVAGKPNRPLLDEAIRRSRLSSPLVVGDRLDTDIAAAVGANLPSLLVLSGVSTGADLIAAIPAERPTAVAFDLRGLRDPRLAAELGSDRPSGDWRVDVEGHELILYAVAPGAESADQGSGADALALAALAALAAVTWSADSPEPGGYTCRSGDSRASVALARLGLTHG